MAAGNGWPSLPSVIIVEILSYLSIQDRLKFTSVCRNWRSCLFNPLLWKSVRLSLATDSADKIKFLTNSCCRYVRDIFIELNTINSKEVKDMCRIITYCMKNKNVQVLCIKSDSCHIEWPVNRTINSFDKFYDDLEVIVTSSRCLRHLSVGFNEELSELVMSLLPQISQRHSRNIQSLHFSSVRADSDNYGIVDFDSNLFRHFSALQCLSLDYDYVSDDLVTAIVASSARIKSLSINIHGIDDAAGNVTDDGWAKLASACTDLQVTMNVVHSRNSVANLPSVLKPHMPLVHYRQLYCSHVNVAAINLMAEQYGAVLQTVHIIDGFVSTDDSNLIPLTYSSADQEDTFVMLAWKCSKLENFTLIGYEIHSDDIIAIARLRQQLATLNIPKSCIKFVPDHNLSDLDMPFKDQVSHSLGRDWSPTSDDNLPPAVRDPNVDAVTSYMGILLEDQAWRGRVEMGTLGSRL